MARGSGRAAPILDMKHGFVNSIVRNQIERDEYDKEQRLLKLEKEIKVATIETEERKRRERRTPLHQVYIPPHQRGKSTTTTDEGSTEQTYQSNESELLLRLEFEGKDGHLTKLNIHKNDDLKKSVRTFASKNGLDSRLRDALYHRILQELRDP